MKELSSIISSFSKREQNHIRKYLQTVSSSDKKLTLFNILCGNTLTNDNYLAHKLYNDHLATYNIKKLKQRLQEDIESIMLLKYNDYENEKNLYLKNEKSSIALLLLANIYLQKNLLSEAHKKLKKSIQLIREHNFIFLESIYYQLHCEYLKRIDSRQLEKNLNNSIKVHSEIQYIQSLKIKNLNIPASDNYYDATVYYKNELQESKSPYSIIYNNLTTMKHLVQNRDIERATILKREILDDIDFNIIKIPQDLLIEVKIQLIKLNLLEEKFDDNTQIFNDIESFGPIQEDLKNEVQQLQFINHFREGNLTDCRSLILRFFFEINHTVSENDTSLMNIWKYFDICVCYAGGAYKRALNLIAQFPARPAVPFGLLINLKILEIHIYYMLDKTELIDLKLPTLRALLSKGKPDCNDRYVHLLKQFEQVQKGEFQNTKRFSENMSPDHLKNMLSYPADVLNYELIPLSYYKKKFQKNEIGINVG